MATPREQDESRFTSNPTDLVVDSHTDDVRPTMMAPLAGRRAWLRAMRTG